MAKSKQPSPQDIRENMRLFEMLLAKLKIAVLQDELGLSDLKQQKILAEIAKIENTL